MGENKVTQMETGKGLELELELGFYILKNMLYFLLCTLATDLLYVYITQHW